MLGASCRALRGSEVCPGLARAGSSRWTPANPRDLCVCAHGPRACPVARRPLMLRSEGRGRSLAQVHSLPTCRLPTAHSGQELDWGCSDFQRKRKALERPQLAPSLLLLPPPVCCPLDAQGSGLVLGAGELAAHAQRAWVNTQVLRVAPQTLCGRQVDSWTERLPVHCHAEPGATGAAWQLWQGQTPTACGGSLWGQGAERGREGPGAATSACTTPAPHTGATASWAPGLRARGPPHPQGQLPLQGL